MPRDYKQKKRRSSRSSGRWTWLFGGLVIRSFVSALFLGILIGTHSSYFVSAPSLYYLKLRHRPEDDKAQTVTP